MRNSEFWKSCGLDYNADSTQIRLMGDVNFEWIFLKLNYKVTGAEHRIP